MTIRHFPTDEWVRQSHKARAALGYMLKLVEDGVLVRNTKDDGNIANFVEQSVRLTRVLKQAQEALAGEAEVTESDMQCGCDESVGFWCAKHAEERSIFLRHPQLKGTTF